MGQGNEFVTGELLDHELIEGRVFVEGVDDIVAIAVRLGAAAILLVIALGIRVPRHIEPMAAPAFAVMGARKQSVDKAFVGIGRLVGNKGVHFSRRRRQADKIERHAANQRPPVGVRGEREFLRLHGGKQQGIDRRADAVVLTERGHFRSMDGAKRPILAVFLGNQCAWSDIGRFLASIGSTGCDPGLDRGDFFRGKFLFAGRHFAGFEPVDEITLVGMSGDNRFTRLAPFDHQAF